MASKRNKNEAFTNKVNDLIASRDAQYQNQGEVLPEDPYAKLSDEEKFALEAAVVNGYPDTSVYASNANALYSRLFDQANEIAEKYHYKPKTEEYDDFIQRYMEAMWPDDQILGVDQARNMHDLYTANMQQQEREKRNAQYRDMNQFGNSAAGISSREIEAAKQQNANNGSIFTGEGLFSGYGQSGKGVGQRFGEANQAASQITPPWQKEPGIG